MSPAEEARLLTLEGAVSRLEDPQSSRQAEDTGWSPRGLAAGLFPAARARAVIPQLLPTGAVTQIVISVPEFDRHTGSPHYVPFLSQLVCRVAGLYLISAYAPYGACGALRVRTILARYRGATATVVASDERVTAAGVFPSCSVSGILELQPGDAVRLFVYHNDPANIFTLVAAGEAPTISFAMLSA